MQPSFSGPARGGRPQQPASLFDHLVGAREQRRRHLKADCFGSVQIDHQFELAGLLNGQLAGLLAPFDFLGVSFFGLEAFQQCYIS